MRYVLLIYNEERNWTTLSPEERAALGREYYACTERMMESGHHRAGEGLEATSTATTVRLRGGQLQTTDGPFAETREQLGGFYLIEAANLDEAIALAARVPAARTGSVEIRPVMEVPKPTAAHLPSAATAAALA
jgi:hypothetical protein